LETYEGVYTPRCTRKFGITGKMNFSRAHRTNRPRFVSIHILLAGTSDLINIFFLVERVGSKIVDISHLFHQKDISLLSVGYWVAFVGEGGKTSQSVPK